MKNILKQNRLLILISITLSFITSIFFLLEILTHRQIISIAEGESTMGKEIVALIIGIYIISYTSYYLKLRFINQTAYRNKLLTNAMYFNNIISQTFSKFREKNYKTEAPTVFTYKVDYITNQFFNEIYNLIYEVTFIILGTSVLAIIDKRIALISIFFYTISSILTYFLSKRNNDHIVAYTEALAKTVSKASDLFQSSHHLIVYNRINQSSRLYNKNLSKFGNNMYKSKVNMELASISLDILSFVREIFVLAYISFISISEFNLANIFIVIFISSMLSEPFRRFSGHVHSILSTTTIRSELNQELTSSESFQQKNIKNQFKIETIELVNVKKSYEDKIILHKFNYKFEKGKKYLITGESGSGKTTLINLITGVIPPDAGEILINGNILDNEKSIYGSYAIILQNSPVFNATMKENITLFSKSIDEKKYNRIKSRLQLEIEDDRILNEHQSTVSGGELQKILLGRALFFDVNCIIFDEAFSALDYQTAQSLERLVLALDDYLLINVAHYSDPKNLKEYDLIFNTSYK